MLHKRADRIRIETKVCEISFLYLHLKSVLRDTCMSFVTDYTKSLDGKPSRLPDELQEHRFHSEF